MKIFISQPMKGLTSEQIKENRCVIRKKLLSKYPDAIITEAVFDIGESQHPVWYLGEALKILSEATDVYFMGGWKNSDLCSVEHMVCYRYNINILHD